MAMALRVLLLLVLFFATVKAQGSIIDLKEVEEDKQQHVGLSQALRVFTRGANRRLVQDIVLKVAKYLNNGDIALAPAPAPPPSPLDCGGTFGNREMCGKCYTEMTTHGNKTKCP
ncbi:hypothetical protein KY284_017653 [Solanum tuberosum]|nr:hypothetical protein KY284_017653 [Solanum tuberosum]